MHTTIILDFHSDDMLCQVTAQIDGKLFGTHLTASYDIPKAVDYYLNLIKSHKINKKNKHAIATSGALHAIS